MSQSSDRLNNIVDSPQITTMNKATKSATQSENNRTQFRNTLAKYVSASDDNMAGAKVSVKPDSKKIPQIAEQMRVNAAASRLKLITALLKAEEKEKKPYDVHSKCLDIARRIMRGKKVSAEEMRFLLQNDPGLYFMAILFRPPEYADDDESVEIDEGEPAKVTGNAATENKATVEAGISDSV